MEEKTLAENQVELTDGRIVEIAEIGGDDEMVVGAYVGDAMEANAGGAMVYQNCLIAQSIISVNGEKRGPLRSFEDFRDFLAKFKGKNWNRIKTKYNEINGDDTKGNGLKVK